MRNSTIEGFFIELKLRKKKWLLCCFYNPHRRFKVINYRDCRNFSNEEFRQQVLKDILKTTQNGDIVSYESFLSICQQALDSSAL